MRLGNGLAGVERERREGNRANAVLLMESRVRPGEARAIVEAERRDCERRLGEALAGFVPSHPSHASRG